MSPRITLGSLQPYSIYSLMPFLQYGRLEGVDSWALRISGLLESRIAGILGILSRLGSELGFRVKDLRIWGLGFKGFGFRV